MPFRLLVPRDVHDAMLAQALSEHPNECCGQLGGTIDGGVGHVRKRYPLVNEAASRVRYSASARSLIDADRDMRQAGLEVLAIYHSHPTSHPVPSRTDLAENYWPGIVTLIISLTEEPPLVRAWWLGENDYQEAAWEIE